VPDLSDQIAALVDRAAPVEIDDVVSRPAPCDPAPRRWRRALVAAVVALAVGGAAAGVALLRTGGEPPQTATVPPGPDATATTPGASSSDTPVASSTPPGSGPPAPASGALDRAALSTTGIGELHFGATLADAEALTGVLPSAEPSCGQGHLDTIELDGASLLFHDGRFFAWSVHGAGWSSVSGVTIGMSASEVQQRVPGLERLDGPGASYLHDPSVPTTLLLDLGPGDTVTAMFGADGRRSSTSDFC
jgi:hypothetical protein